MADKLNNTGEPAIGRGQRVADETHFEDAPDQVGKVRFTHKRETPLPNDEHAFPSSVEPPAAADTAMEDTNELTPSPSVWEAREAGEDDA
jgi:hypothetical protein